MYEKQIYNFIQFAIKEASSIQMEPMNWEIHAGKANAYANVIQALLAADMQFTAEPLLQTETTQAQPVETQTKEALKNTPAPQLEEVESKEEVSSQSEETVSNDEMMNALSDQIKEWLTLDDGPTPEHLAFWTSQIVGEEVKSVEEINNYPDYAQAWMDYMQRWIYLTQCWNMSDIPQVMASITNGQLTKLEDITPNNIDALVTYTMQAAEQQEKAEAAAG